MSYQTSFLDLLNATDDSDLRRADCWPRNGFAGRLERPGPTNGFWRNADWLRCRDERWRPVEPGTFPLAHGIANRVGRLRAYGNAIDLEPAKVFIEAFGGALAEVAA